ncbi:MAG TPA: hypothetical protein VIL74_07595 [Pyrinomonadaceae bacterium]|jgi:hypothetical protein
MIKFIKILWLTCVLSVAATAQTNTDDYKKNEYYVGYSNQQIDSGDNYRPAHGFEAAYVRNVHRYLGLKGSVSGAFRGREQFSLTGSDNNGAYSYRGSSRTEVYNFLGGVQVKNNASDARFKPFAHALAGVAVTRSKLGTLTCTSGDCPAFVDNSAPGTFRDTHFALAVGGGLDIKINDRVDFRAIQVDYNRIYGLRQNNVRFGIGFVFK